MTADQRSEPAVAQPEPPAGRLLANHDFVKVWTGETVSLIGSQITVLALPLVAVLSLHASVLQVGFLNAARYAPVVVFSLLAGVWLDRGRRRPILIGTDLACALMVGAIPLASAFHVLELWLLFTATLLLGVSQVFFDIGSLSFLPRLVERRHLAEANGKMQISYAVAGIAGPSLAGLLIGILTAPITLTIDACSYLVSLAMLLTLKVREPVPEKKEHPPLRRSIAEGLRAVFSNRILSVLLYQSCMFNFAQTGVLTVFVVYAIRYLGMTPAELGIVIGTGSVASFLGATVAGRVRNRFHFGRVLLLASVGACVAPLLLIVPRTAAPADLVLLGAAQAVFGFSLVIYNINTVTLRQVVTPDGLLARMNGSYRMLLFGTGPVGAVAAGVISDAFGLRTAMLAAVLALLSPLIWLPISPVFRLRTMPDGPLESGPDTEGQEK